MHVASISYADDVCLMAPSQSAIEYLILAYQEWCQLLDLKVTKVQVWCLAGPGQLVAVGSAPMKTSAGFRFVGVELGLPDREMKTHWEPRMNKAMAMAQRLRCLPRPASLCAVLWRCAVLPQALYGCEIRQLPVTMMRPLQAHASRPCA